MIWRSTYKESLGDMLAHSFSTYDIDIFNMLWHSYRLSYLIKSSFFQYIRVGDDKYELIVQRYSQTNTYCVKFNKQK